MGHAEELVAWTEWGVGAGCGGDADVVVAHYVAVEAHVVVAEVGWVDAGVLDFDEGFVFCWGVGGLD